jgi:glyceraldehyde 3-phosphate dehydrogenase
MIRVAINGFGRIGRLAFRHLYESPHTDIVAINDITDPATLAHLLKRDSVHGAFPAAIGLEGNVIKAGEESVQVLAERDPTKLPWAGLEVDVVIESTGLFTKREDADKHIQAGARKVVISAPAKGEDLSIVKGVNDHLYDKNKHQVISTASCTTNCLAPVAKVLHESFGLQKGLMTTVHAFTNDQRILDLPHKDLRRARAAAVNIIPTTTGAAVAVTKVLPELVGRLDGMAMRVPVSDGSVVDLVATLDKKVTAEEVNAAMKDAASRTPLIGILQYSEEPLVSTDIIGNPHSSVFDAKSTKVLDGNMVKVVSWYDNEFAYSKRMAEIVEKMI